MSWRDDKAADQRRPDEERPRPPPPPRDRTESESSLNGEEDASTSIKKRQRTISQQYMLASGLTAASPPKYVSLEEIVRASDGMRDMALVHKIATDDNFRLRPAELPENSVQKIIKDTMHKAYWDLLREQLAQDPPNYSQAFKLLDSIKEGLSGVLLPQHIKIKEQIAQVLDGDLIRQQAENGTINFHHYAQYVVMVMSRLCAPVRDDNIKHLKETTDVVDVFKGILELLDLMALDMANFTIGFARSDIVQQSVEFERKKFADILSANPDALQSTRLWMLRHLDLGNVSLPSNLNDIVFLRNLTQRTFYKASMELLEWNSENLYPETFMLDEERLTNLELVANRTIVLGTILLVTGSLVGPDLHSLASFKNALKEHSAILLQSVNTENQLSDALASIAVQILSDIKEAQEKHDFPLFSEDIQNGIKRQILDIAKGDHKIRSLIRQRVKEFFLQIIESSTAAPQKMPAGLNLLQKELTSIAGQFLRIVSHNFTVYAPYYKDIVRSALPTADN